MNAKEWGRYVGVQLDSLSEVDMLGQSTLRHTDKMAEEAARQLYALQEQIDELRRMSTANKILATALQKTQDLFSERLDKVMEYIKCQ